MMIVKPRIRGFICTTAHPDGCAANVQKQIEYVQKQGEVSSGELRNVLVLGCSGGYGLACRVVSAFGCNANTLGVSLEKQPEEKRTASAGWYNNIAFEAAAAEGYAHGCELGSVITQSMLPHSLASVVREHHSASRHV